MVPDILKFKLQRRERYLIHVPKKNGVVASRLRPLNSKPVVISNIIIAMVDLKISG